jgi:tungstate transport system substrate-binding protein
MARLAKASPAESVRSALTRAVVACALAAAALVAGCASGTSAQQALPPLTKDATPFVVVTSPSVRDIGLAAALVSAFRQAYPQYSLDATVVASADPAAFARAQGGDVVLVAQDPSVARLVKEGYASRSLAVMSDRLVLVGPKDDAAGARKAPKVAVALARIADAAQGLSTPGGLPVRFVGLAGDKVVSGLWSASGRRPQGSWYSASATGAAQQVANATETQAYAIVEAAAFQALASGGPLVVLRNGRDMPLRSYVVAPLAGAHDPAVAEVFGDWLAYGSGQDLIARWGIVGTNGPLFTPADASAALWPATR